MRIIAGRFKGRRFRPVPGSSVRSTADRVKESLFNILAGECDGADVLDLFCGAGSLGLEALSRGARRVTFVDSSRRSINCTRDNLAAVNALDQADTIIADALKALRTSIGDKQAFSLILADPPYGRGWSARVLAAVAACPVRAQEGILVIEHHKKEPPGEPPPGFSLWTQRRFGDTMFTIWRWHRVPPSTEPDDIPGEDTP